MIAPIIQATILPVHFTFIINIILYLFDTQKIIISHWHLTLKKDLMGSNLIDCLSPTQIFKWATYPKDSQYDKVGTFTVYSLQLKYSLVFS